MNMKSSNSKKESKLNSVMGLFGWGKKDKVSNHDRKPAGHKTHRIRQDQK